MQAGAGIIHLVGAGPGDPGLMTRRSLELIAAADAILYDRLIPAGALDGARPDAELVYVGKRPGDAAMSQERIGEELVTRAQRGLRVVRLKGGDPFVFGRGAEEAEAARAAGIPFEVVPGITAGVAAPAYAGIPVTHRDDASAVAFVTGHEDPAKAESALDWDALAAFPGTLIIYMGVGNLPAISRQLAAAGRDPSEPAAAIASGTMATQRVVTATLSALPGEVERAGLGAPAILVFGPVARHRDDLAWLERRPLHGKRVVVTRARAQASAMAAELAALGAEVIELPVIRVEPTGDPAVDRAVERIAAGDYALICLTSANGAELLWDALTAAGLDARSLAGATIAAIGPGTARALEEHGIRADVVPPKFVAESLAESLAGIDVSGRPVLVARAATARDVLPDSLRERGAEVDVVALYETVREELDPAGRERVGAADYITFTSSSTVGNLTEALGGDLPAGPRLASIGPVTSEALRTVGREPDLEADRHDTSGLVAAIVADAAGS